VDIFNLILYFKYTGAIISSNGAHQCFVPLFYLVSPWYWPKKGQNM